MLFLIRGGRGWSALGFAPLSCRGEIGSRPTSTRRIQKPQRQSARRMPVDLRPVALAAGAAAVVGVLFFLLRLGSWRLVQPHRNCGLGSFWRPCGKKREDAGPRCCFFHGRRRPRFELTPRGEHVTRGQKRSTSHKKAHWCMSFFAGTHELGRFLMGSRWKLIMLVVRE